MISFALLKIRLVSALIANINNILNAIAVSYREPEFAYYLKRFALSVRAIIKLLI